MSISFNSAFEFTYSEGLCFENFSHTSRELIFFKNGKGETTINGKKYLCKKHSLCCTRPGDIRKQICEKPMDYICIRYQASGLIDDIETGVYNTPDPIFYSLFLNILRESQLQAYHFHTICTLKIAEVITLLVRENKEVGKDKNFYSLLSYINTNHSFNLSIEEMAERVFCSPDHFRHKFKKITGLSPIEYLINKRIEYALELFALKRYNCTQISEICGFSTPGQFSMLFKKKTGVNPRSYK